jgi:hypothetical protein
VRTSTTPTGLYCTQKTAQLCSLVCRDWCDSVLAEARTLRVLGGGGGVGAGSMDRLSGLRLVEVRGDNGDDSESEDTGLSPGYVRSERARWRQVVVIEMRGAPRRLGRLIAALPPAPAACCLPALAELTATGLPPSSVAELSRCLTRDCFPALKKLTLTLVEGCLSPLDLGEEEGDGANKTPPPPIVELSVLGPPIPLGPPSPNATRPEEDAALNLEACATVTPRLLLALANTLRSLSLAVSPSPGAAVLVGQGQADGPLLVDPLFVRGPRPPPRRRRQLVPLEALAPLFVADARGGGASNEERGAAATVARAPTTPHLSRLVLVGDVDLFRPDPNAPVPTPPAPLGGGAAAFAHAQELMQIAADHGQAPPNLVMPPQDEFIARFEASARRFYASGRYQYARRHRRGGPEAFEAVIDALAPGLESLSLLPSLDEDAGKEEAEEEENKGRPPAPPLLLEPEPGLEPRGRLRAWLPECLAGLTRLTELALADGSIDVMRPPLRSDRLSVSRATTGRVPPALRRLTLGGAGAAASAPLTLENDAFAGLPSTLEELHLLAALRRPALPRCLLDGRMPGLRTLGVSAAAARGDAALLSTLASRGVKVLVGDEEAWDDWFASMRYEEGGRGGGGADDDAGSGWSGDGDHWAADYAADSD